MTFSSAGSVGESMTSAAWIGKVSLRLVASGGRVLEGGGGALLAAAVARYFGLGV